MNRPSKSLETLRSRITCRDARRVNSLSLARPPRKHELYHWARIGEGNIGSLFSEIDIAGEQALSRRVERSQMTFGLGPAHTGRKPELRARELLTALGSDLLGLRWGHQVHGSDVVVIGSESDGSLTGTGCVGSCDALVTDQPGVGLVVWTADCVPVLLEGPGVVAAIHSGWRGTAADIVGVVIHRLEREFGVTSGQLYAALGPAISGLHYEVGPEVIDALGSIGSDSEDWRRDDHIDLRLLLADRLRQLGVRRESIGIIGPCTFSTACLASYRRDGDSAGRQFSLVYLRG